MFDLTTLFSGESSWVLDLFSFIFNLILSLFGLTAAIAFMLSVIGTGA